MEEKKLTDEVVVAKNAIPDEEIAKAILQSIEYGKTITYFDEWGNCKSIFVKDILDLIHRLKKENEELKSPKFASWKLKFFNLKEEFDKELSEHEEFTKKAKAEIERLKIDIKNEKNWGKIQTKQAVKDTAEKFAERVNQAINAYRKKVGEDEYVIDARRLIFEVNEICKEFTRREK